VLQSSPNDPVAARQLASRARRRVQGENTVPDADLDTQRQVVEAFPAAARDGDFEALLEVLGPDANCGPPAQHLRRLPTVWHRSCYGCW
jgi:hypothetical protein